MKHEVMNETTPHKKNKNSEILWNYIKYENPLFLAKDLTRAKQEISK